MLVKLGLVKAPVSISVPTTGAVGSDVIADMSNVGSGMIVWFLAAAIAWSIINLSLVMLGSSGVVGRPTISGTTRPSEYTLYLNPSKTTDFGSPVLAFTTPEAISSKKAELRQLLNDPGLD